MRRLVRCCCGLGYLKRELIANSICGAAIRGARRKCSLTRFDGNVSQIACSIPTTMTGLAGANFGQLRRSAMKRRSLLIAGTLFFLTAGYATRAAAQSEKGPYARIAVLRPHDGDTVDFEAGYIRHLEWHSQARDPWIWYRWTVWAGERQRWFVYARFGHSAANLDNPVSPAEDERDNISSVTPHAQFIGNAVYEYLPVLSRGTSEPRPNARLEFTAVEL